MDYDVGGRILVTKKTKFMENKIIKKQFGEFSFDFKVEDGHVMINASQIASAFEVNMGNYLRNTSTTEMLSFLFKKYNSTDANSHRWKAEKGQKLVETHRSTLFNSTDESVMKHILQKGKSKHNPTWMCSLLALDFAYRISVDFRMWVLETFQSFLMSERPEQERYGVLRIKYQQALDELDEERDNTECLIKETDLGERLIRINKFREIVKTKLRRIDRLAAMGQLTIEPFDFEELDKLYIEMAQHVPTLPALDESKE